MSNVVEWPGITSLDLPPEKILNGALEADLEKVVIAGVTKDGEEYFASSMADAGECIYWLQRAIWQLNKMADQMEDGAA